MSDGYSVAQATNGRDALTIVKEWHPELIILDIVMPGMDGGEVAEILERDPKSRDIPIIFLTSLLRKTEQKKSQEHFRNKYLSKPFNRQELLSEIKNSLNNHKRQQQKES